MSQPKVPGIPVQAFTAELRRRWWLPVGLALLGVCLSLVYSLTLGRSYGASATVTINPITSTLFATGPLAQQVDTATEATVMSSGQVMSGAAEALGDGTTADELSRAITVSVPANSLALRVSADGPTADAAADRANAVANSYLGYRASQAQSIVNAFLKKVDARIRALANQAARNSSPGVAEELVTLRGRQSEALTLVIKPGTVISSATPSPGPQWPGLVFMGTIGALFGGLLGMGIVALRVARRAPVISLSDMLVATGDRRPAIAQEMRLGEDVTGRYDAELMTAFADDLMTKMRQTGRTGILTVVGFAGVGPALRQALAQRADPMRVVLMENANYGDALRTVRTADAVVITATVGTTAVKDLEDLHEHVLRFLPGTEQQFILLAHGAPVVMVKRPAPVTPQPAS